VASLPYFNGAIDLLSVDLRIQAYTDPVPLTMEISTQNVGGYTDNFYSVAGVPMRSGSGICDAAAGWLRASGRSVRASDAVSYG